MTGISRKLKKLGCVPWIWGRMDKLQGSEVYVER